MKSAANKGVPVSTPALSHIPLPRRKNSSKGEKVLDYNDTDSEFGGESLATKSQAKISLLGGNAFCCASGQKEDYLPEAKIQPPKKRQPNNATKQSFETSSPNSPLLTSTKNFLKNRKAKIHEANSEDIISQVSETGILRISQEELKVRPIGDSRLRPPDQKGRNPPTSPQRKTSRDFLPHQKDASESKKTPEINKKLRKDAQPRILAKDNCSSRNCKNEGTGSHTKASGDGGEKLNDRRLNLAKSSREKFERESAEIATKLSNLNSHSASSNKNEDYANSDSITDVTDDSFALTTSRDSNLDNDMTDVTKQLHESDDFDCPCCERNMTDGPMSDSEIHVFSSCEVFTSSAPICKTNADDQRDKEDALKLEVETLKGELENQRIKVQTQQDRIQHLEEELQMMKPLRDELEKEKELRKIAEDKLLEVLDHEKRMEAVRKENEKKMVSRGTQKDEPDICAPESSPLMMGYESRVRRYQTYIAKLENDNLTLVNELKKFKDLLLQSPTGQEDPAKVLVEKLGEMQRNSHQQQLQYESCLDEVANRLVHTLLVQKRLEEECKVLHLRVEQLEHENGTLMELVDDDKTENVVKKTEEELKAEPFSSKVQNTLPSHHLIASSPPKKNSTAKKLPISLDTKITEPSKSTNISSVKSPDSSSQTTSPISPGSKPGCTSRIPAFGSAKPAVMRKKTKPEMQLPAKPKNDCNQKETPSALVPNLKSPSSISSTRSKFPVSENSKVTSVKRKRFSRNNSPVEKGIKDSKQRIKTSHMKWDQRKVAPDDLAPLCKSSKSDMSPIQHFPRRQQVWSFNCEMESTTVPESSRKVNDSIDAFKIKKDEENLDDSFKETLHTSDTSTSLDGINRTRDEGYSTMSSDLQPDSAADTTISEPEQSTTFVMTEKGLRSDDSVTECLDGSMCSSSDSGFGPLHLVTNSNVSINTTEENKSSVKDSQKAAQDNTRNISTVRHKDQIASVKPTIRNTPPSNKLSDAKNELCNKSSSICDNCVTSELNYISQLKHKTEELKLSPTKAKTILQELDASLQTSNAENSTKLDYMSMLDYWKCPDDIFEVANRGKTWHLGPKNSKLSERISFCSRHSYIEDNIFDDKIETAEKATLTEPEEERWREKALAPFIDESIWSLYSSEGDIKIKHFPLEPLLSEPSLDKLINCSPCIIVTEDIDKSTQSDLQEQMKSPTTSFDESPVAASNGEEKFKPGLERVASDTVLYLKDAIHELEDSMHRGLKSSKNVSSLHNSGSESEASPLSFRPELLLSLESAVLGQGKLVWPSPTRSSSTSSLQSATSCHVISDEMDDVDVLRTSRKGSQDPDLSSSDAEYENLEHKDFVERWLQNEINTNNNTRTTLTSHLKPVKEISESTPPLSRRKTSLPSPDSHYFHQRSRLMSYPQGPEAYIPHISEDNLNISPCSQNSQKSEIPNTSGSTEDVDFNGVDSEAKEFNGDFYKLCSIGSLRSLESPAKVVDAQSRHLTDSPYLHRKPSGLSTSGLPKSEKPKPTGFVKPTRPVSLPVNVVPRVPEHSSVSCSEKLSTASCSVDAHSNAKSNEVPASLNHSVLQNNPPSLPNPIDQPNELNQTAKMKSPTKFVIKSSSSPKRQLYKRDVAKQNRLKEGYGTAWIHLQANPEISDPTARISLLDSIKAPPSSSGSSSSEGEDEEEVLVIQTNSHLHRICRERRHKVKASANNPLFERKKRSSIVGRRELFYRFGDKEKEAMACFDFLEELPTSSLETLNSRTQPCELLPVQRTATPPSDLFPAGRAVASNKERVSLLSPTPSSKSAAYIDQSSVSKSQFPSFRRLRLPNLWNQPLSHNMSSSTLNSQDCELLDHISLSDSCAESYSSTPESNEDAS